MLEALSVGSPEPTALAELAREKLPKKRPALEEAFQGLMGPHQRLRLAHQLSHVQFLEKKNVQLSQEVEERMRPF